MSGIIIPYPPPGARPSGAAANGETSAPNRLTLTPPNINLVCGDPLLELQANAINTLSNTKIPRTNTWLAVIDWLNDFLALLRSEYAVIFFSIYTQIGLASVGRLVLPVMADDSSRRAVQNALSLVYGLRLPSPIYATLLRAGRRSTGNKALSSWPDAARGGGSGHNGDNADRGRAAPGAFGRESKRPLRPSGSPD